MSKFFIPYDGENPAAVDIKGHKLVIVSTSAEEMLNGLQSLGGDHLEELEVSEGDSQALSEIAAQVNGGVVLSPPGVPVDHMLFDLERELPWVQ